MSGSSTVPPRTSYLLCFTPRNGSALLSDALANTGIAGRPEEFWNPRPRATLQAPTWAAAWRTKSFPEVLEDVFAHGTTENGVFGAKLMWWEMGFLDGQLRRLPGNETLTTAGRLDATFPNLRYIWMTRRDKIRQAVSFFKARQTDTWMLREGEAPPTGRLTFNFQLIDSLLRVIDHTESSWAAFFGRSGIVPFTVVYEDLVLDYEGTVRRVLEHLEVPLPADFELPPPHLQRQSDEVTEEWVRRYYEVAARNLKWRRLLAIPAILCSPSLRRAYLTRRLSYRIGRQDSL